MASNHGSDNDDQLENPAKVYNPPYFLTTFTAQCAKHNCGLDMVNTMAKMMTMH